MVRVLVVLDLCACGLALLLTWPDPLGVFHNLQPPPKDLRVWDVLALGVVAICWAIGRLVASYLRGRRESRGN